MQKHAFISYFLMILLLFSCKNDTSTEGTKNSDNLEDSSQVKQVDSSLETINSNAESLVAGKDESKLNLAQLNVQKLLESCVRKDYAAAASLIMYRGADQTRLGVDAFNYSNPNEANTVRVTCDVINNWLGESESYEFISYSEEQTEYGMQYVVEVLFAKQKIGIDRHFFYLMNSPKGLILVNMI